MGSASFLPLAPSAITDNAQALPRPSSLGCSGGSRTLAVSRSGARPTVARGRARSQRRSPQSSWSGTADPDPGASHPASDFDLPDGAFLVGALDGTDVACGGVCRFDTETAEIRRMYVVPERRGAGLSRRILGALEDEARALGYRRVRLETGVRQNEALALYRSSGFAEIPRYGPYVGDELSVCFEKPL